MALANDHAETITGYRLDCHHLGVEPVDAPRMYPRAGARTPNQTALWHADNLWTNGAAALDDLHRWFDEQADAHLGSEQGGYRGYWEQAVLSMVRPAIELPGLDLLPRVYDWLSTHASYASGCDPGDGVSRIPGPRLGDRFGAGMEAAARDAIRNPPTGSSWRGPGDPAAAVHLAADLGRLLREHVEVSVRNLPRLLSPLVVEVYMHGRRAWVAEFVKAQGGPVWAVVSDDHGRQESVTWRDVTGTDDWRRDAKTWGGKTRKIPRSVPLPSPTMGELLEVWELGPHAPRRVDGAAEPEPPVTPPAPPAPPKPPKGEPPPLFVWQPPHAFEQLRGAQCRLCYRGERAHPISEPVPARAVDSKGKLDPGKRPPREWGVNGAGRPL